MDTFTKIIDSYLICVFSVNDNTKNDRSIVGSRMVTDLFVKVISTPAILGEGVACFNQRKTDILMWVDILGNKIYRMDNLSTNVIQLNKFVEPHLYEYLNKYNYPSIIIPLEKSNDICIIASNTSIIQWNFLTHQIQILAQIYDHQVRFNDGKCDPLGRLWIGTTHLQDQPGQSELYRLEREGCSYSLIPVLKNISISNGLAWSLHGDFMYFIDTPTRAIAVYQYNLSSGTIIGDAPEYLIDLSNEVGVPDGMNIDSDGMLWVAMWDGSQIIRVDPKLKIVVDRIKVGVSRPTNVVISSNVPGRMYVSSAFVNEEPNSGQLICIDTHWRFLGNSFRFL